VTDGQEMELNPDTDGDGVNDGQEAQMERISCRILIAMGK
jgi:hypothetical protein